ncbi:cyclic beta-1,2-glucan synthetase [Thioclava atlantica]|uniref:Cyclic beta-1,2-glucan synthetase n=1 Tax=Thioclava atlantica TaxID=1317124 RepID=A0A085TZN8_9RHOB|nr:cyclic beta-1,2-glucan synthetase [Thioclava atlantica]
MNAIPDWLEEARRACRKPPAEAAKAAEWLLDNEYHVRRAVRQVRADMPWAFYRRLPSLAAPECEGLPRVFLAARGYLEATHAQLSLDSAVHFMEAYQGEDGLTIAELWAFPAMLRLACLEAIVLAFCELVPALEPPFPPAAGAPGEADRDPTEAISRAIVALAAISRIDWKDFVEATSHVEAILRKAPDGLHAQMDFETRDMYRRAVEALAQGSGRSEQRIAQDVIRMAQTHSGAPRKMHSGWWLIGDGRAEMEAMTGFRARPSEAVRRWVLAHAGLAYAGSLLGFGALALALPLALVIFYRAGVVEMLIASVLLIVAASIPAVTVTNWIVTQILPPRVLPKMDYRDGLPAHIQGAVIMPVILRSAPEVPALLEQLERHWLTNPDARLRYALLSDLADAQSETAPEDAAIEEALAAGIVTLNRRHHPDAPFVLLHRRRRWNETDRIWMGWERKRGKIEEFNEFLHGGAEEAFPLREGDVAGLRAARFVVTLDADTMAPPGSVARLIGTLAHPLNRAEFDKRGERVVAGYSFIQPRIEISPEAGGASLFTRLYTGDTAIDIYSRAVSDVYQDLFGEGIFTGKGAYDATAFRQSLRGRVPENALVSHDLFEGLHGRAALASDIVFYEGFPARYPDYALRLHRWIRGDWQLLPWLGRHPPGREERRLRNPLSALDRWKILDNLRRSLIPPALVLLALAGWLIVPRAAPLWTLLVLAAPGTYLVTNVVSGIAHGRRRGAVQERWRQFLDHSGRWALEVVFMANEAILALDAIARALWRLTVSRRRMLEWVTAAHVAEAGAATRARFWTEMAGAPALAVAIGGLLAWLAPGALPGALPLLMLWIASPEIARLIGRPRERPSEALAEKDRTWLRHLARRTWLYFETFAGPEDNWLPPDNYQTEPHEEVAHRSSPTNVGMQFLSTLVALDLGHTGLRDFSVRSAHALGALDRIERHRGHVVNWFDTRTLESLAPRYVSTVDSGNLAVALVTLREGLIEAADGPALSPALWDGLVDTLGLLGDALESLPGSRAGALPDQVEGMIETARHVRNRPLDWARTVRRMRREELRALSEAMPEALEGAPDETVSEAHLWLERSIHHADSLIRDLDALCPWLTIGEDDELAAEIAARWPPDTRLDQLDGVLRDVRARLEDAGAESPARDALLEAVARGSAAQSALRDSLRESAGKASAFATEMDFSFLYDRESRTFFIGYNLSFDRMDLHRYDLLASEARLASYFAIAKGDVRAEHWFHLGRPLSRSSGTLIILSWNGSMFEYLMPALLIRSAPGQLVGQSEAGAVEVQIRYGRRLGLPWGVSEAAFATRDAALRYQYRAFGIVGLGMKQGLAEDYVVAPYASALALATRPRAAIDNLRRLEGMGLRERFGFYDSVDFTPSRRDDPPGYTPVHVFMAHHQGMLLSALGNALCDDILVQRFNRDRRISAIDLLLHERVPWEYVPEPLPDEGAETAVQERREIPVLHGWPASETAEHQCHGFGNGRLSAWLSEAGGATLWWHGQSLTRWAADPLRDESSARLLLHDVSDGEVWDFRRRPDRWVDVMFHAEKASFHLQHHDIAATQEITIAAADDIEIRRVTLVNNGDDTREIEVTSYAEPVLSAHAADERHPLFSKLFLHSETVPRLNGLLFTRRPRRPGDAPPVMLHRLLAEDAAVAFAGTESDRRTFLGRHGSLTDPAVLARALSGTEGWTLDPVAVLRARVRLAPGERAKLAFLTIAAGSRETAFELADRYSSDAALDWAFEDAMRSAAIDADRAGTTQPLLIDAQRLAGPLLAPAIRPPAALDAPLPGQPDLWGLGLSGDLPIVLVRIADADHTDLLPSAVRVQRWWRRHGLRTDLVVLGTTASSYEAPIASRLAEVLRDAGLAESLGGDGGIHLLSADRLTPAQMRALEGLAALTLDGAAATLSQALAPEPEVPPKPPFFAPGGAAGPETAPPLERPSDLGFDNGLGGFSEEGRDYLIHLDPGRTTPAPWCNILANDSFGTLVSEAGLGFTWNLNSGEFRLTPWFNDPVTDAQGEALYLRDEETAEIWTVSPLPAGKGGSVQTTHGAGETGWARNDRGLRQRMSVCVPPDAPVKLVTLHLANTTDRPRRITATYYAEWQLGALASVTRPHVICGYHASARALTARNGWSLEFAGRIAFLAASRPAHSLSCDRDAFLGRGGTARPEGLQRWNLGGRLEAVRDACAAYQVHLDLAPGASEEVTFVLGAAGDGAELERLVADHTRPEGVAAALTQTRDAWDHRLGAVRVETPDPAFDLMINRWLPYQTLASRILARAGFHQAGGGIGFRDQLQDMMALLVSDPARVRAHILACAAHQFEEGDVLHWWHLPGERGVRTRCSDDMMWLVYATHRYVAATGDDTILSETIPFLTAPPLAEDEEDRYAAFETGADPATLLEHCARAMERGASAGAHGLPLIGSGDWNDGMDRVGIHGRGESVWLAWFAALCADAYADLADRAGRDRQAQYWRRRAGELRRAAETSAWDGAWYMRAFDDDGDPWGSKANEECRIDSIAQSWSVLGRSHDGSRAAQAVHSAAERLIDRDLRLVRLLTPPFDRTPRDPGYIRAYPPGVRENGGQYTHAATWLGLAFARLGDGDAAREIFDLINPLRRTETMAQVEAYRGEPYVMPADVGGAPPFGGRAGWTWYTGAAGWAWRLGVEGILGLELSGGKLRIAPCLPRDWYGYRATVRGPAGSLGIEVVAVDEERPAEPSRAPAQEVAPGSLVDFPIDGSVRELRMHIPRARGTEDVSPDQSPTDPPGRTETP